MIFNFCLEWEDGRTDFGVCSADDIDQARAFIQNRVDVLACPKINVEHGCEDLINEQYGGLAFLSTEYSS